MIIILIIKYKERIKKKKEKISKRAQVILFVSSLWNKKKNTQLELDIGIINA